MRRIKSETKAVFSLAWHIIKLPFLLLLVLFGKREFREIISPIKDFIYEIFRPKVTIALCFLLIVTSFIGFFLQEHLFELFVNYPNDIFSTRFYTILTHGFLHASLFHLLGNLLIIYIFGRVIEIEFGPKTLAFIFFIGIIFAGVFSNIANILQGITLGGIGASGGAMALVSVAIFTRPFYFTYFFLIPLPIFVIGWISIYADLLGAVTLTQDGIGYFAHIGGFLTTLLLYFSYFNLEEKNKIKKGFFINLALLLVLLIVLY